MFGRVLESLMSSFLQHGGLPVSNKLFDEIIEVMLGLLSKDVPDNCKQCTQYFQVLCAYVQMVSPHVYSM